MVKIFYLHLLAGLSLAIVSFIYFSPKNYFNDCSLKVITYASFFEGPGKEIFSEYEKEFLCRLDVRVLKTAGMLAQVNQLAQDYDVIIGVDSYQIEKLNQEDYLVSAEDFKHPGYEIADKKLFYNEPAFKLDSAPLTFFIKDVVLQDEIHYYPEQFKNPLKGFYSFEDFVKFLQKKNFKIAVPLPSSSVLGSLYLNWILDYHTDPKDFLNLSQWVYVSSWTEAFGLFEKSLVHGFLSYETSQIYFDKQNQKALSNNAEQISQVFKIEIQTGHPNYIEYFLLSSRSSAQAEDKYRFLNYLYRDEVQRLLLNKNYMWPAKWSLVEAQDHKPIKVVPLKEHRSRKQLLQKWKEIR